MAGERQLPGLGLYGFWTLGSNGYKDQHDGNLRLLSALVQGSFIDFSSFVPGVPTDGDIYVLDATADIHKVILRDLGAWVTVTPQEGWVLYNRTLNAYYVFNGSAWVTLASILGVGSAITTFAGLTDTPSGYAGETLKAVRVNAAETALEFYTPAASSQPFEMMVAVSDETTSLTAGTGKITFRMPRAVTLSAVKASVTGAATGATLLTVDINEDGVSILSTKLTFDDGERTTTTAVTPAVISDTALAADAEITIDIDSVGSTVAGAGLKVTLIGTY